MNSKILRGFSASCRFSLSLIPCFIDLWDSETQLKEKCEPAKGDGRKQSVMVMMEKLCVLRKNFWPFRWAIHGEMGTFPAVLWSSLIILLSCPFFKNARKGTPPLMSKKLLQVPRGSAASLPQMQNPRVSQAPAVPKADFPIPQAHTQSKSPVPELLLQADEWSACFVTRKEGFGFPPCLALRAQFCPHTSLLGPGKQLNIVFSQLSALSKPSAVSAMCW